VDGVAVPGAQGLRDVAKVQVGRALGRDDPLPGDILTCRPPAFGGEALVGRTRDARRTIDDYEPKLVEISCFVHRLGDRHSKDAPLRPKLVGGDGDRLVPVRLSVNPRRDEIAETAAAE